ncbi:MAG: glycosyltransferase family 2 protein, partial [Proteobacteria bacterium]|nr:glycosyltransferase family 2 protein [Pseudomonadota bacterium]
IDNHSNDRQVLDTLAQTFQQFHWEFNRTNLGFTGGNHQGIAWAMKHDFEYLFLLNPDTVIFPDTLQELLRASKSLKDQWIISPLLIRPGNHSDPVIDSAGLAIDRYYRAIDNFQGKRVSQTPLSSEIFPVFGLCGAAMLIPLGLFPLRKSSPHAVFRDDYFAYFEDAEFSWYWKNRGGHFGVCPRVRIEHHRGNRSLLRNITLNRWKSHRFVIEKMILNRYETIS